MTVVFPDCGIPDHHIHVGFKHNYVCFFKTNLLLWLKSSSNHCDELLLSKTSTTNCWDIVDNVIL